MSDGMTCRGSWYLGSACGKCERCYEEARTLLPTMVKSNRAMRELLRDIHEELKEHRRLVSNPLMAARAIASVIGDVDV